MLILKNYSFYTLLAIENVRGQVCCWNCFALFILLGLASLIYSMDPSPYIHNITQVL